MVKKIQNPKSKIQKRGNAIIAIIVGVMAFIVFTMGIVFYTFYQVINIPKSINEMMFGGSTTTQAASSAALQPVDCGNGVNVPKIFMPNIKYSADRFLGGDQAALLAVLQVESRYRPDAISNTGAVGIGQFVAPTARGIKSAGLFRGKEIITVPRADKKDKLVTEAEKVSFRQTYWYEGRLQPGMSIDATAYYFKNALAANGNDVRKAYAEGYNRSKKIQANGKMEKENAAARVGEIYDGLKKDGGCKALQDSPGQLGEDLRKLTNQK